MRLLERPPMVLTCVWVAKITDTRGGSDSLAYATALALRDWWRVISVGAQLGKLDWSRARLPGVTLGTAGPDAGLTLVQPSNLEPWLLKLLWADTCAPNRCLVQWVLAKACLTQWPLRPFEPTIRSLVDLCSPISRAHTHTYSRVFSLALVYLISSLPTHRITCYLCLLSAVSDGLEFVRNNDQSHYLKCSRASNLTPTHHSETSFASVFRNALSAFSLCSLSCSFSVFALCNLWWTCICDLGI